MEYEKRKAELRFSQETRTLFILKLPEDIAKKKLKAIAYHWRCEFRKTCRYEKKDYLFLGLYEDVKPVEEKEKELERYYLEIYPEVDAKIGCTEFNGDSPSLDKILAKSEIV